MKAEKTRNFLRLYFPYREEISRESKIENIEKDCVLEELSKLESIAIKYGEKETPYKVTNKDWKVDGNYITRNIGKCKCGTILGDGIEYCYECGQKLNWEE